jgi:hypothetical protein
MVPLDVKVLRARYQQELLWQLGNHAREGLTLRLSIEAIEAEPTGSLLISEDPV